MLGLLVHRALQWLAEFRLISGSDTSRDSVSSVELTARLQRWLPALKAPPVLHDALIEQAVIQIMDTLRDASGRWILHPHQAAQNEWSLSGVVNDQLVNAVLDRSFIEARQRWVIDYKTGSPSHGEMVDAFVRLEINRYRPQLKRYKILLSALEPITVRTALYFTALSRFEEIQID